MISKGRVVCSRFILQLLGFLSVSYQNTKIRQGNLLKLLVERGGKIVIARSYNHVRKLMKFIFFVDLTSATEWALSDEWKDELRRREEEMVQAVEEAER